MQFTNRLNQIILYSFLKPEHRRNYLDKLILSVHLQTPLDINLSCIFFDNICVKRRILEKPMHDRIGYRHFMCPRISFPGSTPSYCRQKEKNSQQKPKQPLKHLLLSNHFRTNILKKQCRGHIFSTEISVIRKIIFTFVLYNMVL